MRIEREGLRFPELVKEHFLFLEEQFGYSVARASTTFVRYESQSLFVNVYHGRVSFEIGVELGRLGQAAPLAYDFPVIMKAMVPNYDEPTVLTAMESMALKHCLSQIASAIRTHCGKLLRAEEDALRAVEEADSSASEEATRHYTVGPVKQRALEAWQRRDYAKATVLYESIESELSPVEKRRLAYAKKIMKRNSS